MELFALGDSVETDDGWIGRIVGVFLDGAFAKSYCECYYCNRPRRLPGYTERLCEVDEPMYLIESGRGIVGIERASKTHRVRALAFAAGRMPIYGGHDVRMPIMQGSRTKGAR